jgi:Flp pilus assembly protein TadG
MRRGARVQAALRHRLHDDRGAAILEFAVLGVCVIMPLVYVVLTVMQVQSAAYAVTAAAREAGRALATAPSDAEGLDRAEVAVRLALADQGITAADALRVECPACWRSGGTTTIRIAVDVALPLIPDGLGTISAVPVRAEHLVTADRYAGVP